MNVLESYVVYFLLPFLAILAVLLVLPFLPSNKKDIIKSFFPSKLGKPKKLLVVDDAGGPLADIQNYFNHHQKGYEVIIASTVEEAEKMLKEYLPDYAAIDLRLLNEGESPYQNVEYQGIEVIGTILAERMETKPIILSGHKWEEVEETVEKKFAQFPEMISDLKSNYVYKGTRDAGGYIKILLDTLRRLEKAKD